jgi:peptide/nickel transport system permease protein
MRIAQPIPVAARAPGARAGGGFSRALLRKPVGLVAAVICAAFVGAGSFAPVLAPYGMNATNPSQRLQTPSWRHPLGTDHLGRDLLTRILWGARVSVIIAFSAATLATAIALVLGVASGYFGGRADILLQRFVDAWMSFPALVVLIVFAAVMGPGGPQIVILLGLLYGIGGSRIVRSAVLPVRENLYVEAARSLGAGTAGILFRHILPNIAAPVIVLFSTQVGQAILAESGLSFLGLGVPPPAPTWGGMLAGAGRTYMYLAPWLAVAPGICLTLVVWGVNMFGDALRDILDPRLRQ